MYIHPDVMFHHASQRQRELIAEADQYRLLTLARRERRERRARNARTAGGGASGGASGRGEDEHAGTLAACAPTAAPAG